MARSIELKHAGSSVCNSRAATGRATE
jgi:hypothetical protein